MVSWKRSNQGLCVGVSDLCLRITASLPGRKTELEPTLQAKITLDCSHITKIRDQIYYVSHLFSQLQALCIAAAHLIFTVCSLIPDNCCPRMTIQMSRNYLIPEPLYLLSQPCINSKTHISVISLKLHLTPLHWEMLTAQDFCSMHPSNSWDGAARKKKFAM